MAPRTQTPDDLFTIFNLGHVIRASHEKRTKKAVATPKGEVVFESDSDDSESE